MAKLLVEIHVEGSAKEVMKHIEDNKDDYFPVGNNFISVDSAELRVDPTDNDFYLFKLRGVIDEETGG